MVRLLLDGLLLLFVVFCCNNAVATVGFDSFIVELALILLTVTPCI